MPPIPDFFRILYTRNIIIPKKIETHIFMAIKGLSLGPVFFSAQARFLRYQKIYVALLINRRGINRIIDIATATIELFDNIRINNNPPFFSPNYNNLSSSLNHVY